MPDSLYEPTVRARSAHRLWCASGGPWRRVALTLLAVTLAFDATVVAAAALTSGLAGMPVDALFKEGSFVTVFSSMQLLLMAGVSFIVVRWLWELAGAGGGAVTVTGAARSELALWLMMGAGFIILALDESAAIHERLDHALHGMLGLRQTPWTDRIDDLIVLSYGLAGLAVLWTCRAAVRRWREAWPVFATGFALFFITVSIDLLTNSYSIQPQSGAQARRFELLAAWAAVIEDTFKVCSEGAFIAALAAVALPIRARAVQRRVIQRFEAVAELVPAS